MEMPDLRRAKKYIPGPQKCHAVLWVRSADDIATVQKKYGNPRALAVWGVYIGSTVEVSGDLFMSFSE